MATEQAIVFQGELQMARWSESSTNGATVTFWVHPEDLEAFKVMKARSGKTPGMRLGAVMVAIGDDEQIVKEPAPVPRRPDVPRPAMGECGRIAVLWCRDPDFQRWVALGNQDHEPYNEALCKEAILDACGVFAKYGEQASRKHLDVDADCTRLFHERIRIPFRDWLIANNIQK